MIGKLLKWLGFSKKEPKPMRLQPRKYKDPLYPTDLAEQFPDNRTEDVTDNHLWQSYGHDED